MLIKREKWQYILRKDDNTFAGYSLQWKLLSRVVGYLMVKGNHTCTDVYPYRDEFYRSPYSH